MADSLRTRSPRRSPRTVVNGEAWENKESKPRGRKNIEEGKENMDTSQIVPAVCIMIILRILCFIHINLTAATTKEYLSNW